MSGFGGNESKVFGVANNPDPVPSVRRINTASWNNQRPAGVADSLQIRKHFVEFHRDDSSNVLSKDETGSRFTNNAAHLRPEMAVVLRASSEAGVGKRLAGKPASKQVNSVEVTSVEVSYVGYKDGWAVTSFRLEHPPFSKAS